MARLVLVALFLISASPPKTADYERCIMLKGPPLDENLTHPMEGNAPVSELARWDR